MKFLTQFSRIFVGVLFIISGLIKANDTIGFSYKLVEYFDLFNLSFFAPYAVAFSMLICIFEIVSGVALLLGIYARLNAWLLLLLIVFFTLLTGYSAITHKVTDCGCFGDAIKLKPFGSFMKDVVLLVFILVIFSGIKHIRPLFNKVLMNILLSVSLLISTFFTFYTYMFLPVVDFLPYKIGNHLQELMIIPEGESKGEYEMLFIYEKAGEKFEFTVKTLPQDIDQYKFIDRIDKVIKEPFKPLIHDFKIYDEAGVEYTDSIFAKDTYKLIFVQLNIKDSRKGSGLQIAELSNQWMKQGLEFWALTASNLSEANAYKAENELPFNYFNMDGTPIKSMVRSNPGLLLLKKDKVIKKWGAFNLPSYNTVLKYMQQ